jgi:oligopeptide transport system substrate-binding protein
LAYDLGELRFAEYQRKKMTKEQLLEKTAFNAVLRFPNFFDTRLMKGLLQLRGNTCEDFIDSRTFFSLRRILFMQYYLQKKMENACSTASDRRHLFLNLLPLSPFSFSVGLMVSVSLKNELFSIKNILEEFTAVFPSVKEIKNSFYTWYSTQFQYQFYYIEFQKLRGNSPSRNTLRQMQQGICERLMQSITPFCPPVFWPQNEEESYRQLLALKKEVSKSNDIPQIAIHFRTQTINSLEFFVHLVRPKIRQNQQKLIVDLLERLPSTVNCFILFSKEFKDPIPIEAHVFSLNIPSNQFFEDNAVNLLKARRMVFQYLQELLGPFRDFNGGLFEKQQERYEEFKNYLSSKNKNLRYSEPLFYSLQPIEIRITLAPEIIEELLCMLQVVINNNHDYLERNNSYNFIIIKSVSVSNLPSLCDKSRELEEVASEVLYGFLKISKDYYFYFASKEQLFFNSFKTELFKQKNLITRKKVLRLNFLEGLPPTFNPFFIYKDIRSRVVGNLLFEGLVRFNTQGKIIPAGAKSIHCSQDGLCYIFKIRKNNWSNGEKVTAHHFEQSWKRALCECDQSGYLNIFLIFKNASNFIQNACNISEVGIKALDDETLEIKLEYPDPSFLMKLTESLFYPILGNSNEPQWFNGPFKISQSTQSSLYLERNYFFWDKDVYFDQVKISMESDPKIAYALYQKQELDWIGDPICPIPNELLLSNQKILKKIATTRFFWLYINTQSPLLKSYHIRQALSSSLNRNYICRNILIGDQPLLTPLPSPLSMCSLKIIEDSAMANNNFNLGLQKLGVSKESFPELTLTFSEVSGGSSLAEYLKFVWENTFDIKIKTIHLEWNDFRNHLEKGQFQIGGCFGTPLYDNAVSLLERFEFLDTCNISKWISHPFKMHLSQAKRELNEEKRNIHIKNAEEILISELPFIPISTHAHYFLHHNHLRGFVFDKGGCVDFRWAYID